MSRQRAELRGGFDPDVASADRRARNRSLFFDDLLDAKVQEFNSRYAEAKGALLGDFRHRRTDICGKGEFIECMRNRYDFVDVDAKRERDMILSTRN